MSLQKKLFPLFKNYFIVVSLTPLPPQTSWFFSHRSLWRTDFEEHVAWQRKGQDCRCTLRSYRTRSPEDGGPTPFQQLSPHVCEHLTGSCLSLALGPLLCLLHWFSLPVHGHDCGAPPWCFHLSYLSNSSLRDGDLLSLSFHLGAESSQFSSAGAWCLPSVCPVSGGCCRFPLEAAPS